MYMKVYLPLAKDEYQAIEKIAEKEMRGFRDQARLLLRDVLIERGAIHPTSELAVKVQPR